MKYLSSSPAQTLKLGKKIARQLKGREVLGLVGELGAGKTVFIKGLAKGLGVKKIITSPTFVLMKIYQTKNKRIKELVHIDCYRLKQPAELLAIGIKDYLKKSQTVVVIEWADKIKKILPRDTIWVTIKLGKKKNERIIGIYKC